MEDINIFWHRRDLRLKDNTGLYHALNDEQQVLPLFIFDTRILDRLEDRSDSRVSFIHRHILQLSNDLAAKGSSLFVGHGRPISVFSELCDQYNISAVYCNHDYEPVAIERDETIRFFLKEKGIAFHTYKDQCIFEKNEVLKSDGEPYTVFTPYMRAWKKSLDPGQLDRTAGEPAWHNLYRSDPLPIPSLNDLGFEPSSLTVAPPAIDDEVLKKYELQRDYPAIDATSKMSVHLRFGTVSIRYLVKRGLESSEIWLNELIWREFFMMILWHFPHVVNQSFRPLYDRIKWRNDEQMFKAWCEGKTGYPIVDAGMRELNTTGFMHNRVRMITASFLVKDLLTDWRWGEAYFAKKLLDYELSSNNGNWQWVAGTGCDAAPYFRVFNPELQTKKFDPQWTYIRKWVPEFDELTYPRPIVDHKMARERALKAYREALQ